MVAIRQAEWKVHFFGQSVLPATSVMCEAWTMRRDERTRLEWIRAGVMPSPLPEAFGIGEDVLVEHAYVLRDGQSRVNGWKWITLWSRLFV